MNGMAVSEPIAVVGLAMRLPGAKSSAKELFEIMKEGRRTRREVPSDRGNIDAYYDPDSDRPSATNVRHGNFLDNDMSAFDAPFFSIQPLEAESMDPQQRTIMEVSYQALEDAGISLDNAAGSNTGVYIANTSHDFEVMQYRDPERLPKYMMTGVGPSLLANRLSWFFDFRGPSITMNTGCSGSLVALHCACQSLRSGESRMALAGGVSLILVPEVTLSQLSTLGFLSPDGYCHSFDSRANGYSKSEGAGIVVLKRFSDAVADGDTIRAIIRSTSTNQDGRTPGITQPSISAQAENIRSCYKIAGLDLDQTLYVEAHGTGTTIGDYTEAAAVQQAFQRSAENPIYMGALKANIGHLEAGSGVASLIKCIIVLETGVIPPIAGLDQLNPQVSQDGDLLFPRKAVRFPDGVRRVSLNGFGYGGTNAHAVLDDARSYIRDSGTNGKYSTIYGEETEHSANAPPIEQTYKSPHAFVTNGYNTNGSPPEAHPIVLLFTAGDEHGVQRLADAYHTYLKDSHFEAGAERTKFLVNLSYTLSQRRSVLPWKSFAIVRGCSQEGLAVSIRKPIRTSRPPSLAYVFTGQGAQWHAMTQGLMSYSVFRNSIQVSGSFLRGHGCEWDIFQELDQDEKTSQMDRPAFSQALCTALQIALVDQLASWNIRPAAVCGHSSGEIAAAYCIGALSHESAVVAAWHRGRLAETIAASCQGGMLAVALSEEDLAPYMSQSMEKSGGRISVGCVNAPRNLTITGDTSAIDTLQSLINNTGAFSRKLRVDVAYHSHHMAKIATQYTNAIHSIRPGAPVDVPMFSSVTGKLIHSETLSAPRYWVENMVSKVEFSEAVSNLAAHVSDPFGKNVSNTAVVLLEIGPHSALQRPINDTLLSLSHSSAFNYDSLLTRHVNSRLSIAEAMGRLSCQGYHVNLAAVSGAEEAALQSLTDLPVYPFNHCNPHWTESRFSRLMRFRQNKRSLFLGTREMDWNPLKPRWRNVMRVSDQPWLLGQRVQGINQVPPASLLVMAIEAVLQLSTIKPISYHLDGIRFPASLSVPSDAEDLEFNTSLTQNGESYSFQIFMVRGDDWIEACAGTVTAQNNARLTKKLETLDLEALRKPDYSNRWDSCLPMQFYNHLAECGYEYSSQLQTLSNLRTTKDGRSAAITTHTDNKATDGSKETSIVHPIDLEAIFQACLAAHTRGDNIRIPIIRPTEIKSLWVAASNPHGPEGKTALLAQPSFRGYRHTDYNIRAVDHDQSPIFLVEGLRVAVTGKEYVGGNANRSCYYLNWQPDLDLMSAKQVEEYCRNSMDPSAINSDETRLKMEFVCQYYLQRILNTIHPERIKSMPSYLQKYMRYIKRTFDLDKFHKLGTQIVGSEKLFLDETRDAFLDEFAQSSPEGALHRLSGENAHKVLNGEMDALELFFGDGRTLSNYYLSLVPRMKGLEAYIDLAAHKRPDLNIFEIGAGTGSATGGILARLADYTHRTDGRRDIPRAAHYTFSDVTPSFFEEAKTKFKKYEDLMTYSTFDIERDPIEQGYTEGQFDIVVANSVLHVTKSLSESLQNVRKVLRPDGKLLLFEVVEPGTARTGLSFALLPGWWLSEEPEREWSPLLSVENWDKLLKANGFSGASIQFLDHSDPTQALCAGIVATVTDMSMNVNGTLSPPTAREKLLVVALRSEGLAEAVADLLSKDHAVTIATLESLAPCEISESHCIFLIETESSFFLSMSDSQWKLIKEVLETVKSTLWVSCGAAEPCTDPSRSFMRGLGRSLRVENIVSKLTELALTSEPCAKQICRVYRQSRRSDGSLVVDEAYREVDGQICISRLLEEPKVDNRLHLATGHRLTERWRLDSKSIPAMKLTISTPGDLESLCFDRDHLGDKPLEPSEIEIRVVAARAGFHDLQVALGASPGDVLGHACAGVVERVGTQGGPFQPGDRVWACTSSGGLKTIVRTDRKLVSQLPDHVAFQDAAAMSFVFATAHYSLIDVGNLKRGETVYIHDGFTALGQAAIQLAQIIGADIFTSARANEKSILEARYSLPGACIFDMESDSLDEVKQHARDGVDVVFHSGGGQRLFSVLIAPFGREVAVHEGDRPPHIFRLSSNISFHPVNMRSIMQHAATRLEQTIKALFGLLAAKRIKPPCTYKTFPMSQVTEAFRELEVHEARRDIVVEMDPNEQILQSLEPLWQFDPDATYLIAGGFGGLGATMIEWMVERKARHLVILSRSGGDKNEASRDLIRRFSLDGTEIYAPRCDITDAAQVEATLRQCSKTMPPIKGCIQAAMVLKTGLLRSITAVDVHESLAPKVAGTLNLEEHLPSNIDFFVLLSSISSEAGGQAIGPYTMANSFLDAFARKRAAEGKPCICLNLGAVNSVGIVVERDLSGAISRHGLETLNKAEFLALLEWACDPATQSTHDPAKVQLLTGLAGAENMSPERFQSRDWMKSATMQTLAQLNRMVHGAPAAPKERALADEEWTAQFIAAENEGKARDVALRALIDRFARLLAIPPVDVDPYRPIATLGIDSLIGLELKQWLKRTMQVNIEANEIQQTGSIELLAETVAAQSELRKESGARKKSSFKKSPSGNGSRAGSP